MTRRSLIAAALGAPLASYGQMATRDVQAKPRGKPSGLPFNGWLVDIAEKAGLTHPVIYGDVDANAYILEAIGCGVAFIDYDNDGWLDIFVLSGLRWGGVPAGTSNRLYKNNRDGTFADVTEKAGLLYTGWTCGVTVGGLQQRRVRRHLRHRMGPQPALPQQRQRHVHRGHETGGPRRRRPALEHGLRLLRLRPRRQPRPLRLQLREVRPQEDSARPARRDNCNWRGVPVNCGPRGLPPGSCSLFHNNGDGTFTDVTGRFGHRQSRRAATD